MKPKLLLCLTLVLIGAAWVAFISSDRFSNWLLERKQYPDFQEVSRSNDTSGTWAKKLKTPWTDTKVVLYRSTGEIVQLAAKTAVYSVWSTRASTNQHKPFDAPVAALIDPVTGNAWVGRVDTGEIETNEFTHANGSISTNFLIYTNLFIETGSEIVRGDNIIDGGEFFDGSFTWDESVIKPGQSGERLDALIEQFETNRSSVWPFKHTHGESRFGHYFRRDFFSSGNMGAQSIPIQHIQVSAGKLRLDFDSWQLGTKGSVWLDLKTFAILKTVEYRPVSFNLKTFWWGILPAFMGILLAMATLLLARQVRNPTHYLVTAGLLVCVLWSLVMLWRICVLGSWPTHLPFFHPAIALGDWVLYLPGLVIAFVTIMVAAQALMVRFDRTKTK